MSRTQRTSLPRGPLAILAVVVTAACGVPVWEPSLHPPEAPPPASPRDAPYLKAHLASGDLLVLTTWSSSEDESILTGSGRRYDAFRRPSGEGILSVPADSVVLLESNRPERVGQVARGVLIVNTVTTAALTMICVADPKACFGSCPTFYMLDGPGESLVAEGFSSSFARVLEATDVDAIPSPSSTGRRVSLLMRNEAPETHAVRSVRLRAVPRDGRGTVVATGDGRLFRAGPAGPPVACRADGVDCLEPVLRADGTEYFTSADPADLGAKQIIELDLPAPEGVGELALALRARNSLLSTFLFYRTIATLGDGAADWLAEMERGRPAFLDRSLGLARALGDVEVQVAGEDGAWRPVGAFAEAGPIAADEQVVPLDETEEPVRVRLVMTRGNWRIDRVGLVRLVEPVEPLLVEPTAVRAVSSAHGALGADLAEEADANATASLLDPDRYLVTGRGDAHLLTFDLPAPASDFALFLESRGYYYEWIRGEWRGQGDPALAHLIFTRPEAALRRLAPEYAEREGAMEAVFWSSRFRREGR